MPYTITHHYRWDGGKKQGSVLVGMAGTQADSIKLLEELYSSRVKNGEDFVTVQDETGKQIARWEVMYMPQFEADPGMKWPFPSSSNPSKSYVAQVNKGSGIVSCNCTAWVMGWKKNWQKNALPGTKAPYRHCKHTDEVVRKQKLEVTVNGQYMLLVDPKILAAKTKYLSAAMKATGPQARFAVLVQEYEDAIAEMAALDPAQMFLLVPKVEQKKYIVEAFMGLLEQHGIDGTAQFEAAQAKLEAAVAR